MHPFGSWRSRVLARVVCLVAPLAVLVGGAPAAQADAQRPGTTPSIINGADVSVGDFATRWPFIVSLSLNDGSPDDDAHICGGSLIEPDVVLTAAHCVTSGAGVVDPPTDYLVVANRRILSSVLSEGIAVHNIVVHPSYNPSTYANDAAIMRLVAPVPGAVTIDMVGAGDTALWGNNVTGVAVNGALGPWVAGWGDTTPQELDGTTYVPSATLQEVAVPIVTDAACSAGYGSNLIGGVMLCAGVLDTVPGGAGNNGADSCQGDSGGPLIVGQAGPVYKLAGIVSWGYDCADDDHYGVYTQVDAVRGWVEAAVAAPPHLVEVPKVTGVTQAGSTLTCVRAEWSAASTATLTWIRSVPGQGEVRLTTGSTYLLSDADVGSTLSCEDAAAGAGWNEVARSAETVTVRAVPIVVPPPPPVPPALPTISLLSRSCQTRTCTVLLNATSGAEVTEVTAQVIRLTTRTCFKGKGKKRRKAKCEKRHSVRETVSPAGGTKWRVVVPHVRGNYRITATTHDSLGRKSPTATFRVRLS